MKRIIVRLICNFFHFSGINVCRLKYDRKAYTRISVVTGLLVCTLFSLSMYGIINRRSIEESIKTVTYMNSTILMLLVNIKFLQLRKQIRIQLQKIDDNIFKYSNEREIEMTYEWFLDERHIGAIYRWILAYQVFGFALAGMAPFIGFLVGKNVSFLVYPGWTPWSTNGPFKFILTYVYQSLTASSVFWMLYLSQTFVVFVVIEFLRQNKRLRAALSTLEDRTMKQILRLSKCNPEYRNYQFNRIFANKLKECVRHHQELAK